MEEPMSEFAADTPETLAGVAEGKAKLDAMLKGEATAAPTPRAPKPTAPKYTPSADAETRMAAIKRDPAFYQVGTQKQQKLAHELHDLLVGAPPCSGETENRAAIRVLNESGKLTSPDPAVRAGAMSELRKRLAAESTEAERDAIANAPIDALRDQFKVDHSKVLAPIRNRWDTEEEATILATFSQQGVQPEAVTEIAGWYQGVSRCFQRSAGPRGEHRRRGRRGRVQGARHEAWHH
jgi:hypothetical protein